MDASFLTYSGICVLLFNSKAYFFDIHKWLVVKRGQVDNGWHENTHFFS